MILCYDSDNAGINAAIRTGYILMQNGFEVRIIDLGNDLDPDDYFKLKENDNNSFKSLIKGAVHPINFIINKKNISDKGASDQSKFVNECIEEIKLVKDVMIRNDLIKRLSNEMGVVETEILNRFESLKAKRVFKNDKKEEDKKSTNHYNSKADRAQIEIIKLLIHNHSHAASLDIALFDNKLCYNIVKTIKDNIGKYLSLIHI